MMFQHKLSVCHAAFVCLLVAHWFATKVAGQELPIATPEAAGMRATFSADIDRVVAQQIEAGKLPGCVVLVGRGGTIVHRRAYGNRSINPTVDSMTIDTVFDLASLTKPIATSTSIMQLVERGKLRLRDKVTEYLPEFGQHGKNNATIEHLLTHASGLPPVISMQRFSSDPTMLMQTFCELEPIAAPGEVFKYSDVGYLILGAIVQRASGQPLDEYTAEHVFRPLNMTDTTFNPPESLSQRAATTEKVEGDWLKGVVHDPRSRALGGVAGHAGLFSTADDLSIYAQTLLNLGERNNVRVLAPRTIQQWTTARSIDGSKRGLGWDMGSVYSRNRGEMMSKRAFGHGGFTGTAMWIDPELDLFVIFLSNRVHPDGKGEVNDLAGRIGTIASAACLTDAMDSSPLKLGRRKAQNTEVKIGIDVLQMQEFDILKGQRVGLIANHTSRDTAGRPTIEVLSNSSAVNLVALFSPEHGLQGVEDHADIKDSVHTATQLPVYSLYGDNRKPTAEQLSKVDVLVFDIQDIGCRFYTYLSTMGLAMEAAAESGKEFVVLDRPNPIGGVLVEGPVLDEGSESFVGYHRIPVRHGMTLGELAEMIRVEKELDLDLTVVRVIGWDRRCYQYSTNLPWINTSPNMRSLTEAVLYPGVGLFETTNVSVGRGTDTPFEVLGAPWIKSREFAAAVSSHRSPGVHVVPISFTPDASKHKGVECGGVYFVVTDWNAFRSLNLAWTIGASLVDLYPNQWESDRFNRLLGNQETLEALLSGAKPQAVKAGYDAELHEFYKRRQRCLAY